MCVCVCVSHPGQRVFHHHFSTSRGPAADKQTLANKAMLARWMRSETSDRVPAKKLLPTLSTPLVCFMVFHVFHPLNRFPTTAFSCRRSAALLQMSEQIVKHFSCADLSPYVSLTFLPNVILALTEKSKFEVCPAQPSHSGAECDPLHRGAVFAWESNHPNAPPITGTSQESTDPHFESTATPAAGPKNGF